MKASTAKRKKLIVLSADAMVEEDLELLSTLPNFRKYLAGGCRVNKVRSIYPTITYACHATMATGVYPETHGILGNLEFCPGNLTPPWKWFSDALRFPESIFKSAKEAGYSTAAMYWPHHRQSPLYRLSHRRILDPVSRRDLPGRLPPLRVLRGRAGHYRPAQGRRGPAAAPGL